MDKQAYFISSVILFCTSTLIFSNASEMLIYNTAEDAIYLFFHLLRIKPSGTVCLLLAIILLYKAFKKKG